MKHKEGMRLDRVSKENYIANGKKDRRLIIIITPVDIRALYVEKIPTFARDVRDGKLLRKVQSI